MAQHPHEALTFAIGEVKALPHTLSETRRLTLTLTRVNAVEGTADFELHNPEAQPDDMAAGLVWENAVNAVEGNQWRDKLHLPEKTVPVDTSTMPVVAIHATLHEKLQIGDRLWKLTEVSGGSATLTPGHDFEDHTLVNEAVEESGYSPEAIAAAERLDGINRSL